MAVNAGAQSPSQDSFGLVGRARRRLTTSELDLCWRLARRSPGTTLEVAAMERRSHCVGPHRRYACRRDSAELPAGGHARGRVYGNQPPSSPDSAPQPNGGSTAGAPMSAGVASSTQAPQALRHRRNARQLTAGQQADLRRAIRGPRNQRRPRLSALGRDPRPTPTDLLHPPSHFFLPWHRAYLYFFEKALQERVPGVTLPGGTGPTTRGDPRPPTLAAVSAGGRIPSLTRRFSPPEGPTPGRCEPYANRNPPEACRHSPKSTPRWRTETFSPSNANSRTCTAGFTSGLEAPWPASPRRRTTRSSGRTTA